MIIFIYQISNKRMKRGLLHITYEYMHIKFVTRTGYVYGLNCDGGKLETYLVDNPDKSYIINRTWFARCFGRCAMRHLCPDSLSRQDWNYLVWYNEYS